MLQRLKTIWRRIRTGEVASEGENRLFYEGFGQFVFREGEFSTPIHAEPLTGPVNTVIHAAELEFWDPPHDREEIPEQKRAQIVRMLEKWLVSTGETVKIDWGSDPAD